MKLTVVSKESGETHVADSPSVDDVLSFKQQVFARGGADHSHNQLYLHIPYCTHRCTFCCYYRQGLASRADLDRLLDKFEREMSHFAALFSTTHFGALYVGGGTPSVLSIPQLARLFELTRQHFTLTREQANEVAIELSPLSTSLQKVVALRETGVTRVSMGIQSLDPELLRRNGRPAADSEQVLRLVRDVADVGFSEFNADLMAGIPGRTSKNLEYDFAALAASGCGTITVYIDQATYRSAKRVADRQRVVDQIESLYQAVRDRFSLNGGAGPNEYNLFVSRSSPSTLRYRFTTDLQQRKDVLCLGIGEYAVSSTKRMMVWSEP
jgi:coproporphyrinogen III oxidase-like Fe-S oxidoreductase